MSGIWQRYLSVDVITCWLLILYAWTLFHIWFVL